MGICRVTKTHKCSRWFSWAAKNWQPLAALKGPFQGLILILLSDLDNHEAWFTTILPRNLSQSPAWFSEISSIRLPIFIRDLRLLKNFYIRSLLVKTGNLSFLGNNKSQVRKCDSNWKCHRVHIRQGIEFVFIFFSILKSNNSLQSQIPKEHKINIFSKKISCSLFLVLFNSILKQCMEDTNESD